jgi:copper homeostasis protein
MTREKPEVIVEVCVDSAASAIAAERGGAARLELCGSLIEGGITPSAGLLEMTRAAVSVSLQVMIRPRGGDFCYDPDEFEIMRHDIAIAKRLGANGVVFGILDVNGNVDIARTRTLAEFAHPLEVTFHRAFDMSADLLLALEDICSAGADRILTSGGKSSSLLGRARIAQLIKNARGRVGIMPGGGIKPGNVRRLVDQTGAKQVHVSLLRPFPSPMLHRNSIAMGSLGGREYERFLVVEEDVRKLRSALGEC